MDLLLMMFMVPRSDLKQNDEMQSTSLTSSPMKSASRRDSSLVFSHLMQNTPD